MLDLDEDARLLQTETVWRGKDVHAAIGTISGDSGVIPHRPQDPRDELLHLLPVKRGDAIFDELFGLLLDVFAQIGAGDFRLTTRNWLTNQ